MQCHLYMHAAGSYGNLGCDGGRMTDVFRYIMAKGSQSESSYPYKATVMNYRFMTCACMCILFTTWCI